ncbi:hypothetical protein M0805_003603 [Coniferiporia weirii]|nr:hypothetical protein M0805_003603 [Coniferiporia weirii]
MFERIRNYFYERRGGFFTAAGVAGTIYMTGTYITERLEEMREQAVQMQNTRENLRRRFQKNQEDVQFTVMTHLPTLGSAVIAGMDVESVTRELQMRSRLQRARAHSPDAAASESSLASSVELVREAAPSNAGTHSAGVDAGSSAMGDSVMSMSTQAQSWVEEFSSQVVGTSTGPALAIPSPPVGRRSPTLESPLSNIGTDVSVSISASVSLPSTSASVSEKGHSRASHSESSEPELSALSSKTKVELWNEVKMLTFTRILTIVYSTTLLTLLTTMQLNIIGRLKYVQSVLQLHREEKLRERRMMQMSISSLLLNSLTGTNGDLERWLEEDVQDADFITPETEHKFLTLSWWLLYVGWKDVGERVRKSVEEVFEGVSLKSRLGPMELHRLVCDVRRRVEHEFTYEGTERKINFLSTMIPPTPETLSLVFSEGGVPGYRATHTSNPPPYSGPQSYPSSSTSQSHQQRKNPESDPTFARLLGELRETVISPAFAQVLEVSLDRATDVLFDGLRRDAFGGADADMDTELEKPRLANLLPALARWAHSALDTMPNELVDSVADLKEITALSAIIYSNYDTHLR